MGEAVSASGFWLFGVQNVASKSSKSSQRSSTRVSDSFYLTEQDSPERQDTHTHTRTLTHSHYLLHRPLHYDDKLSNHAPAHPAHTTHPTHSGFKILKPTFHLTIKTAPKE